MADENTATESTAEKAKSVAENMAPRRVFGNINEAVEYLKATATAIPDFNTIVEAGGLAAPGMDEEGNFDSNIYGEGTEVMVSVLRKQGKGVKAIVVAPVPTLDSLLGDEAGRDWVQRIIHKELNHVAVRHLRDAEDIQSMVDQMPTTREGYITSAREAGGGIMESFDELYKLINATLSAKFTPWGKQRLIKTELRKAFESKGYAAEYYPALEDYKGESLFALGLQLGINAAKKKGLDPTIFERWAATRDAKAFSPADETDEDDFDIDSLTDSLLESEAGDEEAAPASEPEAEAPTAVESEAPAEAPATEEAPAS